MKKLSILVAALTICISFIVYASGHIDTGLPYPPNDTQSETPNIAPSKPRAIKTSSESIQLKAHNNQQNVILVILDGIRWQDFFNDPSYTFNSDDSPYFQSLWQAINTHGFAIGNRQESSFMSVITYAWSLPSYQSMFAGYALPCNHNDCDASEALGFHQNIKETLALNDQQVAIFSYWKNLARAENPERVNIIRPELETQTDAKTITSAFNYLDKNTPRLMTIVLGEADHVAHRFRKDAYTQQLGNYELFSKALIENVRKKGQDYADNTTIIFTTDHGRANYFHWAAHVGFAPAKYVYMAAINAGQKQVKVMKKSRYSLADLRPSIENLFGLETTPCEDKSCGSAIIYYPSVKTNTIAARTLL